MTDPMQELRRRFVERCRGDLKRLDAAQEGESDASVLEDLAHSLAGAGGTFGFPEVSEAAARLDDRFAAGQTPPPDEVAALRHELQRLVDAA